jgi:hypothetical protein
MYVVERILFGCAVIVQLLDENNLKLRISEVIS